MPRGEWPGPRVERLQPLPSRRLERPRQDVYLGQVRHDDRRPMLTESVGPPDPVDADDHAEPAIP